MTDEVSFLPESLRSEFPDFIVWWTGTLGQAEWLITHTPALRGRSVARSCPSNLRGIPDSLRPLLALEQPDLIITRLDGTPLISIEITEQQEFGLNAQQRMARFWSAVACKVPSAYLLPLESYQIEKASQSLALILDEVDPARREVLLSGAALKGVRGESLWKGGIHSRSDLVFNISNGASAIAKRSRQGVIDYWNKHVRRDGEVKHIPSVPFFEHLRYVDDIPYKAYLRTTGMPTAMLLKWMALCSERVPTYPFKMQSQRDLIFRTNGVLHTMEDPMNPHLSFRNLPPGPSVSEIVSTRAGKDEITLFIEFVDSVITEVKHNELDREMFTRPNEYFPSDSEHNWRAYGASSETVLSADSGDFQLTSKEMRKCVSHLNKTAVEKLSAHSFTTINDLILAYNDFHVYKISCSKVRDLSDPYSGALAVRDVLFCRNELTNDFASFRRSAGLVFMVDLTDDAATDHLFLYRSLLRQYQTYCNSDERIDPQDQVIALSKAVRIEEIPKHIRCHLLFADLILVRRTTSDGIHFEAIAGFAGLMKLGKIDTSCSVIRSLTI